MKNARTEYMRELGRKGGKATSKKYGSSHFKSLGEKGQKALLKKISDKK